MKKNTCITAAILVFLMFSVSSLAQVAMLENKDSVWRHSRKNIVRYNLSSALLFGFDKAVIIGYERLVNPRQSFSINVGKAGLPKLIAVFTDSFNIKQDIKNTGFNFSVDYRFYLTNENRYATPHGLYIGPYYSYNRIDRTNAWEGVSSGNERKVNTKTDLDIHTVGFELGYQFVFWKRATLDLVMVGPGVGFYKFKATAEGNVNVAEREQLLQALKQALEQRVPGFNWVFSDQELTGNGTVSTTTIGYRYLIQIGFRF